MMKDSKSSSWYIQVRNLFWQYDLEDPDVILVNPVEREKCKKTINKEIDSWWFRFFKDQAKHLKSLKYLNIDCVTPNKPHPLLQNLARSSHDANRQIVKMKFMSGSYILQCHRAKFSKNQGDATCKLCGEAPETMKHLVLDCMMLSTVRDPIINDINAEIDALQPGFWQDLAPEDKMTGQLFGASLLAGTGLAFTYYTLWVIVMPFVDEDQDYIHALFPDRKFAVAIPLLAGVIGLLVIGCFVSVVLLKSSFKHKTS